jgi:hypothetical protein
MRRPLSAAFALFALPFLAGCPSNEALCKSGADQVCERLHEASCRPIAEQGFGGSAQFQAVFGTDAANCKELFYANPLRPRAQGLACSEVDTDQQLCTNLGQPNATTFDLGKAQECRDARAALSCQEFVAQLSPTGSPPASCAERCK